MGIIIPLKFALPALALIIILITGIGLYLCKKILDKLSHEITIESSINVGTTVKIHFPSIKTIIE